MTHRLASKKGLSRSLPTIGAVMALVAATLTVGSTAAVALGDSAASSHATSSVIIFLKNNDTGVAGRSAARSSFVRGETSPLVDQLRSSSASDITALKSLPIVFASVTSSERSWLVGNPAVLAVLPNSVIHETPMAPTGPSATTSAQNVAPRTPPTVCGTALNPEIDPEAYSVIKANEANAAGYTGAGVTVAYIADGVDPTNPDFQRNAAYASAGSLTGTPVLTQVNFDGDPSGTPTDGGEAYLDSSSIAAQGNTVYNLNDYVSTSHPTPSSTCDIKIVGAAPGADVLGLSVFSTDYNTTEANFIQAIDYAVTAGAKVLNESFGSNEFPDTALDATRLADNAAVAAGVTVVASSGDSGYTNTIGSPATDPNLISVGASTTFRSYEQTTYGGINDPSANGTWINNNISSISSGGFAQNGDATVDLVAPGDSNWALCSADITQYNDCSNFLFNGSGSPIEFTGGTSESSPLTAAAAADVIQAYASTHSGADPTPALVKRILMSTATDIDAPASQQGAGLLNVYAAVKEATSLPGTSATPSGGLLVSPNEINVSQAARATTHQTISLTNSGSSAVTVHLSTRALTHTVSSPSGSFCLDPSAVSIAGCGAPTATSFPIWSGVVEVYQNVPFTVPAMSGASRLNFSAIYPYTGQDSLMHVALLSPSGAYAGYSLPQGLADFANVQVADPAPGTWTAVFFTEKNTNTSTGTSGHIKWVATNTEFAPAGTISPATLSIPAGATRTANFSATSPRTAGDADQSIVLSTSAGVSTIPVTVRTEIPLTSRGGVFSGVLTGGNGRGNPAQMNTYSFQVPAGKQNLDVSATFQDPNDAVVAFLVDPNGQALASSSSITFNQAGSGLVATNTVQLYAAYPEVGTWTVVLDWLSPTSGLALTDTFHGAVRFNEVTLHATLPTSSSVTLQAGHSYRFNVRVTNSGVAPQRFFIDPRTSGTEDLTLPDYNGSETNVSLPLSGGVDFPIYVVPTHTTQLDSTLVGTAPISYDFGLFTGDPDLATGAPGPGVVVTQTGDSASASLTEPEITPGLWYLNPSEVGPYGSGGEPPATATASATAVTQRFDPTVTSSTGDLWEYLNDLTSSFTPAYVLPESSVVLHVTITPTASVGTVVSGAINVDDAFQANELIGVANSGGDELGALHFTYTVG